MTVEGLETLIREYANFFFENNPVMASVLGVHDHDRELGHFSPEALEEKGRRLKDLRRRVHAFLKRAALVFFPWRRRLISIY